MVVIYQSFPWDMVLAIGVLLAANSARMAANSAQLKSELDLYMTFSQMYDELKLGMPKTLQAGGTAEKGSEMEHRYRQHLFAIFRLFEREYGLYEIGVVPKRIWRIWRTGMQEYMDLPAVREFLAEHEVEFDENFIRAIMK